MDGPEIWAPCTRIARNDSLLISLSLSLAKFRARREFMLIDPILPRGLTDGTPRQKHGMPRCDAMAKHGVARSGAAWHSGSAMERRDLAR